MVFGLGLAIVLARGSVLKACIMVVFGLLLPRSARDIETGQDRLTLGLVDLQDGIDFAVLAMGVFGHCRDPAQSRNPEARATCAAPSAAAASLADLRRAFGPIVRATGIGSGAGILPATGRCWRLQRPTRWRRSSPGSLALRQGRHRGGRDRAATMPAPRPRSFRC
jgi:putative tricarboxylic transport membrane protein